MDEHIKRKKEFDTVMLQVYYEKFEGLIYLYINLTSGAIMDIDPKLIKCLMEKDWTNG